MVTERETEAVNGEVRGKTLQRGVQSDGWTFSGLWCYLSEQGRDAAEVQLAGVLSKGVGEARGVEG